jgi:hypothetical protein
MDGKRKGRDTGKSHGRETKIQPLCRHFRSFRYAPPATLSSLRTRTEDNVTARRRRSASIPNPIRPSRSSGERADFPAAAKRSSIYILPSPRNLNKLQKTKNQPTPPPKAQQGLKSKDVLRDLMKAEKSVVSRLARKKEEESKRAR